MCSDTSGSVITGKAQVLKRRVQYFNYLCNRNISIQQDPEEDIERNDDLKPTKEEIEEAIENLKNDKSPGIDSVQAELLCNGSEELINTLQKLLELIWRKERITNPLYNRGDPLQCITMGV
jgi:hypothetical protein